MNTDFLERIYKEAFPMEEEVAEAVKDESPLLFRFLKSHLTHAAVGAAAGGGGAYAMTQNQGMSPMARGSSVLMNGIAGGIIGENPKATWEGISKWLTPDALRPLQRLKAPLLAAGIIGAEEGIPSATNLLTQTGKNLGASAAAYAAEAQAATRIAAQQAASSTASANFQNTLSKSIPYALGGAGLLGLGAIAANYFKPKSDSSVTVNTPPVFAGGGGAPSSEKSREGQLHVKLPVKRQGDHDTSVDIPLSQLNISKTILDRIGRDTRRRLRSETNANTLHRKHLNLEQPSLLN